MEQGPEPARVRTATQPLGVAGDLLRVQRQHGNRYVQQLQSQLWKAEDDSVSPQTAKTVQVSRVLLRSPALLQLALDNRRRVQQEIMRLTEVPAVPSSVTQEMLARVRLRRRIQNLSRRMIELYRRHYVCFPNGDCGYVGMTQTEYTDAQSRLLDQVQDLRKQIRQRHWDAVPLSNVRLAVVDPLGEDLAQDDALRIGETIHTFEEGMTFGVETQWKSQRGFPSLPQERPHQGLLYLFFAVTQPSDIAANNQAAAETARSAVVANPAIYDAKLDRAAVNQVNSIAEFANLWATWAAFARQNSLKVRQIEVFSHGGLDGPMFGPDRRQFGLNGAPSLSALLPLPYTGDAIVFFRGCRIGAGSFLESFGRLQSVATYGFKGTTSFSTRPERFDAWQSGTPAYQLDFPGSETWSRVIGRHPAPTPPQGYVPHRETVQRKTLKINLLRLGKVSSSGRVDRQAAGVPAATPVAAGPTTDGLLNEWLAGHTDHHLSSDQSWITGQWPTGGNINDLNAAFRADIQGLLAFVTATPGAGFTIISYARTPAKQHVMHVSQYIRKGWVSYNRYKFSRWPGVLAAGGYSALKTLPETERSGQLAAIGNPEVLDIVWDTGSQISSAADGSALAAAYHIGMNNPVANGGAAYSWPTGNQSESRHGSGAAVDAEPAQLPNIVTIRQNQARTWPTLAALQEEMGAGNVQTLPATGTEPQGYRVTGLPTVARRDAFYELFFRVRSAARAGFVDPEHFQAP